MKLDNQKTLNLLGMINSPDEDNHHIALKSLDAFDFDDVDTRGYVLFLYKMGTLPLSRYEESTKADAFLKETIGLELCTYGKCLQILFKMKVSKEMLNFFLANHITKLVNTLKDIGYPMDNLDLKLSLKDTLE